MIQRIIDFLFRPDFEQFARVNIVFYCACLCAGAFIGSGIAVFVVSGAVFGIFHFCTGRLRWSLPKPVTAVYFTFCGFFAAELISALIHPSAIALNEVIENLPFLGFAAIYSITVVDRKSLLRNVERAAAWAAIVAAVILAFIFDVNYRPELSAGNAGVLSLLAGILYVLLVGAAIRRNDRMLLFYMAAAACAAFVVIVTGTRSIWPALILVPILGLFAFRPMRQVLLGSVAVMVVLVGLAGIGMTLSETLQIRVSSTASDVQSSFSGDLSGSIGQRLQIYRAGYELFLEKPLLGYGPGNERAEIARKTLETGGSEISFSHAHNVLLNVALRAGILGILAFAALIIVPVVVVSRARRDAVAQAGFFTLYGMLALYLLAGAAGLMLGNDIHDAAFIAGVCYSLYLVFGRKPIGAAGSNIGPGTGAVCPSRRALQSYRASFIGRGQMPDTPNMHGWTAINFSFWVQGDSKMNTSEMRLAVAGCGGWGKNIVKNIAALGVLRAISDTHPATAAQFSADYGVPALSLDEIAASAEIDAVCIAVPAELHLPVATQMLEAGKHVFVEKPLALSVADGEKLAAIAKKAGRVLMVGHLLQYHPVFKALLALVKAGDIGTPRYVYSNRMSLGKIRQEENVLWSFAPHDISMVLALAGEAPNRVLATGTAAHVSPNLVDFATTHLGFPSGLEAHILVSWLNPFKEQRLVVVGDKGMAVFDDVRPWAEKLEVFDSKVDWVDGRPVASKGASRFIDVPQAEPLREECRHFIEAAGANRPALTDAAEGLRVLSVLEQAETQLRAKLGTAAKPNYFVHETAIVDDGVTIGANSKIWHFSHVLSGSIIGGDTIVGQNVVIGPSVTVGTNCKIQNNVSLYNGVELEDDVFCGPSCVFTNVKTPRAHVSRKHEFLKTLVKRGATIGANATIICGNTLGEYCMIGSGSTVTKDVPPHALWLGSPAKPFGWVSRRGARLGDDLVCPESGERYEPDPATGGLKLIT